MATPVKHFMRIPHLDDSHKPLPSFQMPKPERITKGEGVKIPRATITQIKELLGYERSSFDDFEVELINDVRERYLKYTNETRLSQKQIDKITEIHSRLEMQALSPL